MFRDQLFIAVKEPCTYFLYWMISSKQQPIYVTLFNWSLYKDEAMEGSAMGLHTSAIYITVLQELNTQ